MGRSSVGRTGRPFSLLDELCGCEGVDNETAEWPLMGGWSSYLRYNLSPCLYYHLSLD